MQATLIASRRTSITMLSYTRRWDYQQWALAPSKSHGGGRRMLCVTCAIKLYPFYRTGISRLRGVWSLAHSMVPTVGSRQSPSHSKSIKLCSPDFETGKSKSCGRLLTLHRCSVSSAQRSFHDVGDFDALVDPNHLVSASKSPACVFSPTQATYPSGRINTAVGAVTAPITGSFH